MKSFSQFNEDLTLQYHNILNQQLFDGDNLKPEVRQKMLAVADLWLDFIGIDKDQIDDILFTGGNASFGYNQYSDLDIHILMHVSNLGGNEKFINDYLYDKKMMFSIKYNIKIKGYPVEMFVQDIGDHLAASAVYSLQNNVWIQKPTNLNLDLTHNAEIEEKERYYEDLVNKAIRQDVDIDKMKEIKTQIIALRKTSLSVTGNEYDPNNLLFKELRNRKVLDKIDNYVITKMNQAYSLE